MQVRNVNSTDLRSAIELGCRAMVSVQNPEDRHIPWFGAELRPVARFSFGGQYQEAHLAGRHLNALLNAREVLGLAVDEQVIDHLAEATYFSYSGPAPFPMNRDRIGGPLVHFAPHNIREGFHALYALVKYRGCPRAQHLAERSIDAILRWWTPQRGWEVQRVKEETGVEMTQALGLSFITGLGRAIGPLVKYYRVTGYTPALELALTLKDQALAEGFPADGRYDPEKSATHTHSVTCTMSSLAQLADLTGDQSLLRRVKTFYDHGLWDIRDEIGWVLERANWRDTAPDRGEGNNTGDIVETALILGRWGWTEYFHDAERILRCHLLPSQLRDVSWARTVENPENQDCLRDVADRQLGAWGFPAPYGHAPLELPGPGAIEFCMDIVGGVVGSLCEVIRETIRHDQAGHWVNLLFDHETEALKVESPYTHPVLAITTKRPGPLFVRMPPWARLSQEESTFPPPWGRQGGGRLDESGPPHKTLWNNGYLFLPQVVPHRPVRLPFALESSQIVLRSHGQRQIRVHLRGDSVAAMDNFGADLTFFPPIE